MRDFEVTGINQIVILLLILLYLQIVIPQPLRMLSKKKNGVRQWMRKLQL